MNYLRLIARLINSTVPATSCMVIREGRATVYGDWGDLEVILKMTQFRWIGLEMYGGCEK
jgi:hypothetical protein